MKRPAPHQGGVTTLQTIEQRTVRKVTWGLLPLIVIILFVAYIDRTTSASPRGR